MNTQTSPPIVWDLFISPSSRFSVEVTPSLLDLIENLRKAMLAVGATAIESRSWEVLSDTKGVRTTQEGDSSSDFSVLVVSPHQVYWRSLHDTGPPSENNWKTHSLSQQEIKEARLGFLMKRAQSALAAREAPAHQEPEDDARTSPA